MSADDQDDYDDGEIVCRVREILGARLTAYIAGVHETQIVRAWADGTVTPSPEVSQRLRLTYRIAAEVAQHEGNEMAQAWFMGVNPGLDDAAPARLIRDGDLDHIWCNLEMAMRSFRFDAGI